jgi:hypothetical protein
MGYSVTGVIGNLVMYSDIMAFIAFWYWHCSVSFNLDGGYFGRSTLKIGLILGLVIDESMRAHDWG